MYFLQKGTCKGVGREQRNWPPSTPSEVKILPYRHLSAKTWTFGIAEDPWEAGCTVFTERMNSRNKATKIKRAKDVKIRPPLQSIAATMNTSKPRDSCVWTLRVDVITIWESTMKQLNLNNLWSSLMPIPAAVTNLTTREVVTSTPSITILRLSILQKREACLVENVLPQPMEPL